MFQFAASQNCTELLSFTEEYVYSRFLDVVHEEEFVLLPVEKLCDLLGSENIQIDEEHQTLKAALVWIEHDVEHRRKQLRKLVNNVRFPFITPTALANLIEECTDSNLAQDLISVTGELSELQLESGERTVSQIPSQSFKELLSWWCYPRLSARRNIFLIGGCTQPDGIYNTRSELALDSCECYSTYLKQWQRVPSMNVGRSWHGTCRLNGMIYVAGGESESLIFSSVECYDPQTTRWMLLPEMVMPRCGLGLAALGGKVYAFGGWVGSEIGITVESYDPKENTWQVGKKFCISLSLINYKFYGLVLIILF